MALDFTLTDEQKMIVETTRKFKEKECTKENVREWDKSETFPAHVWKKLGEIGLLGAAFPEQYGGFGWGRGKGIFFPCLRPPVRLEEKREIIFQFWRIEPGIRRLRKLS